MTLDFTLSCMARWVARSSNGCPSRRLGLPGPPLERSENTIGCFEGRQGVHRTGANTTCVPIRKVQISDHSTVLSPQTSRFTCQRDKFNVCFPASSTTCRKKARSIRPSFRVQTTSTSRQRQRETRTKAVLLPQANCELSLPLLKRQRLPNCFTINTAPPAPAPHQHRSRHDLNSRRLSHTRLACDSYAPHPSPGIPHEQPQHVFC